MSAADAAAAAIANATAAQNQRYQTCEAVSVFCPVKLTTLGYYPNKGANIFFAVGFGLAAVVALSIGTWKRTWSYMVFLVGGCFLEVAGYGARAALAENPWNRAAFETQICAIILGPTLICVSIYLTLKHVTAAISPALSRVPPRIYPLIFVPADVSCLLIQAIGGALAALSGRQSPPDIDMLNAGNRAIIAGICLQVVVLGVFGAMSYDFFARSKRWIASGEGVDEETLRLWNDRKFRSFVYAVAAAYFAIFARCVYRIAEMAGGWGNHIMQDEPSFIVMDSVMVVVASLLLAGFAPGVFFPQMAGNMSGNKDKTNKNPVSENEAEKGTAPTSADGLADAAVEPKA